jgi:hypothetical protein
VCSSDLSLRGQVFHLQLPAGSLPTVYVPRPMILNHPLFQISLLIGELLQGFSFSIK